ncbi:TerC family protein [Pantoea sp. SoEX]|uniref:TerC family protein n=1 Tax=Pantoea sp. SoEX TaxID=2576763 RepID=UPI0013580420|nr:hypothetical protein [Pantoea sp. SoEX]MXP50923.1 hypothetical protein [Pantoea sp. SoEX]
MEIILHPSIWIDLLALVVLEILLGIDNLVFITILTDNLPIKQRDQARLIGLSIALVMRLILIFFISWLIAFNNFNFSGRNLILLVGGLFLVFKSIIELYKRLENNQNNIISTSKINNNFWFIIIQVVILDVIFSLDSVITAVGIINNLTLIIVAVIISTMIMFFLSKPLNKFFSLYPSVTIICLSFLLVMGVFLIAESLNFYIPRSYLYSIITFSIFIEIFNQISKKNSIRNRKYSNVNIMKYKNILHVKNKKNNLRSDNDNTYLFLSEIIDSEHFTKEFDKLFSKTIKCIMTPRDRVDWIDITESIDNIRNKLTQNPHNIFPICHKNLDKIIGIAKAKDILILLNLESNIGNLTSNNKPVTFVLDSINSFQLIEIIYTSQHDFIIVINEFGMIQGIITTFDILKTFTNLFSEVIKEKNNCFFN